jgi:hypothetical protein
MGTAAAMSSLGAEPPQSHQDTPLGFNKNDAIGNPDCAGCGYKLPTPADVLMPGGDPIGTVQRGNPAIRTVQNEQKLIAIFNSLTVNATPYTPTTPYNGEMYKLPGGGTVGLRYVSKSGGLTLDIGISGIPIIRIHLPWKWHGMQVMQLTKLQKNILELCIDDWTGIWGITSIITNFNYSDVLPNWVRQETIRTIRELMEMGVIEAGVIDPDNDKFKPFNFTVAETIAFIEQEWDKLDKAPTIGDICWLSATDLGEKIARELGIMG